MLTLSPKVRARRWAALVAALLLLPLAGAVGTPSPAAANGACLAGSGTSLDPFLVATAADVALVGSGTNGCSTSSHYLQTTDITLTTAWTPISSFSGSYDGGGHTIGGLSVNVGTGGGLFANTTTGALLRRIRIVDGSVTGGSNTGGLVGSATATRIEDAHFSGSVTSTGNSVGGLVGYTITDGTTKQPTTILRSSTSGTVTAQGNNVGGLVGYLADGGVRSSFSTADVTGGGVNVGGLVGHALSLSPSAKPLPLVVTGSTTATTSSGAGSIVTGDTFHWSVVLDLNSASTDVDEFNDALKAVTLTASPTNTGTWSPDAIVWSLGPAKNVLVYDNVQETQLVLQIEAASGAPAIDGVAFGDLDLTLFWEVADLDGVTGQADLQRFFGTTRPPLETAEVVLGIRTSGFGGTQVLYSATIERDQPQTGDVVDVSARGDVTVGLTKVNIGGAVGTFGSSTRGARVLSTGAVSVTGGGANVGGLAGSASSGSLSDSFWDTESSGLATSAGGAGVTGRTTAQMTAFATFAAWPIVDGWQPYSAGVRTRGICSSVNDGYPFLLWQYTSNPCSVSAAAAPAAPTLDVTCSDAGPAGTLAIGTPITCTVTGGDPDIDILWRAAYNPTFAEGVVRTGADGTGTLVLTVPAAATGSPVTVELVAWTAPILVGTASGPIPTAVNAGGGSTANAWLLVLGASMLVAVATAANPVAPRRRRDANA